MWVYNQRCVLCEHFKAFGGACAKLYIYMYNKEVIALSLSEYGVRVFSLLFV